MEADFFFVLEDYKFWVLYYSVFFLAYFTMIYKLNIWNWINENNEPLTGLELLFKFLLFIIITSILFWVIHYIVLVLVINIYYFIWNLFEFIKFYFY